jgi:hypothetical protein
LLQERDKDKLALELGILHDRLTSAYRRLTLIASNEEFSAKDRIDAEALLEAVFTKTRCRD